MVAFQPVLNASVGINSLLVNIIRLNSGSYIAVNPNPFIGLSSPHDEVRS